MAFDLFRFILGIVFLYLGTNIRIVTIKPEDTK